MEWIKYGAAADVCTNTWDFGVSLPSLCTSAHLGVGHRSTYAQMGTVCWSGIFANNITSPYTLLVTVGNTTMTLVYYLISVYFIMLLQSTGQQPARDRAIRSV